MKEEKILINFFLIKAFYDRIGIRFYVTENYRKNEFGVLIVGGDEFWQGITIPPRADKFNIDFSCRESCLDVSFCFFRLFCAFTVEAVKM